MSPFSDATLSRDATDLVENVTLMELFEVEAIQHMRRSHELHANFAMVQLSISIDHKVSSSANTYDTVVSPMLQRILCCGLLTRADLAGI